MQRVCGAVLLMGVLIVPAYSERAPILKAVKGLDPVELAGGKEVPGKKDQSVEYGRYRYHFTTAKTKAIFEKDPARYAIQMGGACARMGVLSGMGHPDRFTIHEGRIYIFASEACRNAFLKAPRKFIDQGDPLPEGSELERQRGKELVARAVEGLGGAAHLDSLTSLRWQNSVTYKVQDGTVQVITRHALKFPNSYRREINWGSGYAAVVVQGDQGFRDENKVWWPLVEVERSSFRREYLRHPIVLLRERNQPGFRAVATGKGKVGETEVEWVQIGYQGATTRLGIEPRKGRILAIRHPAYGMQGIDPVEKIFSDFKACDKLTLPHRVQSGPEGKAEKSKPESIENLEVNTRIEENLFRNPDAAR